MNAQRQIKSVMNYSEGRQFLAECMVWPIRKKLGLYNNFEEEENKHKMATEKLDYYIHKKEIIEKWTKYSLFRKKICIANVH